MAMLSKPLLYSYYWLKFINATESVEVELGKYIVMADKGWRLSEKRNDHFIFAKNNWGDFENSYIGIGLCPSSFTCEENSTHQLDSGIKAKLCGVKFGNYTALLGESDLLVNSEDSEKLLDFLKSISVKSN